jgi:hypothetical protein
MKQVGLLDFRECALQQGKPASCTRHRDKPHTSFGVLEISGVTLTIIPHIGEDEMKSIIKSLFGVYGVVGIVTLVMQFYERYPNCSGVTGCGLSYGKGVVWSAIWPIYWWIQLH